jgi:AmmeMemoRadiSam system protein A
VQTNCYDESQREILLELAHRSIECGLSHGSPATVAVSDYSKELTRDRACFVTLHLAGKLRGCIGSIESSRPLVIDVADRAFAAANKDPRFSPLQGHEFERVDIEISVLLPLERIDVASEQELLSELSPGFDGLILQDGGSRGVFLPAVWESLPDPVEFVSQLRSKARLPVDYWSSSLQLWKFQTETFGNHPGQ